MASLSVTGRSLSGRTLPRINAGGSVCNVCGVVSGVVGGVVEGEVGGRVSEEFGGEVCCEIDGEV